MEPKYLQSMSEILPEHCFNTKGSKPIKVLCNDMNDYVCKYHKSNGFASTLFNEYIAASFLKIWKLAVPDFAFVKVKNEHIRQIQMPYHYFDMLCYGSRYEINMPEVDKLFLLTPYVKKSNESGLISFLKIALFDIWLCNEDRHYNNFNLLYDLKNNVFVPIDHVFCFNSNNLPMQPELISDNESILNTPFVSHFFSRTLQQEKRLIRLRIVDDFKNDIHNCREALDDILFHTPLGWLPDKSFLRHQLLLYFSEQWISDCLNHFNCLFEINSVKKIK